MTKYIITGAIAILGLFLLSCGDIRTTTITLTYTVDEISSTNNIVHMRTIDLTEEEDYVDHRDDIESVDQISVVAWIYNDGTDTVSASLYADTIDTYTTEDEVTTNSHIVFNPIVHIAGADSTLINWSDGFVYMMNTDYLDDLIMNHGSITVYLIGEGDPPYDVRINAEIVITLTVKI